MSQNQENENRRDFYRVTDQAYLQVEPLDDPDIKLHQSDPMSHPISAFESSRELMTEMALLERDLARILGSVSDREQPLTAAIRILNRKIEAMARATIINQSRLTELEIREISLSQGGLAVRDSADWRADSHVRIKLILLPSYLTLSLDAKTLDSIPIPGGFLTRFEFHEISSEDQDLLSRHILKVQQHNLRESR